jgi:predicted neuraminidase
MQSMTTAACVLVSRDSGASWTPAGDIEDAKTWLVNPTLEQGSKGQLIALFRTSTDKTYSSSSTDQGKTWSRPAGNALPNPNSTFATVTIDGQVGMRATGGEGCGFMHRRVAGWVAAVATVRRAPLLAVLRLPG